MLKLNKILLLALTLLLTISCNTEITVLSSNQDGVLCLALDYDPSVILVRTKAGTADIEYNVTIKNAADNSVIREIEKYNVMDTVHLEKGAYLVEVTSGKNSVAAFNSPFYSGSTQVTVEPGIHTTAKVICTLSNVKITVEMSETIVKNFTRYDVEFKNDSTSSNSLYYSTDSINSKSCAGYMSCTGKLFYKFHFTNTDGDSFDSPCWSEIDEVKPKNHYHLTVDISTDKSTKGSALLSVAIDDAMIKRSHDFIVNLNASSIPVILADNNDVEEYNEKIQLSKASDKGVFDISVSNEISSLVLSHNNVALQQLGVPTTIDLFKAAPAVIQSLSNLGIVYKLHSLKHATVSMGAMLAGNSTNTYSFMLFVTDSENQYDKLNATIKVIPNSEASILSVTPDLYTAYVEAEYNTDQEPAGLGIQYKESSSNIWINYNGEFTKDGTKISATISELKAVTKYDFRVVTENEPETDNIFRAETKNGPQLYNFGFDSWWLKDQTGGGWYPNEQDNKVWFWDTANAGATTLNKNNSSTTPEYDHIVGGKAACKMQSISVLGVFASGNIYTGQFVKREGTSAILDQGQPWNSSYRPDSLVGWYDYRPVTVDKAQDPRKDRMGKMDRGVIYVAFLDWTARHRVNSSDPSTIMNLGVEDPSKRDPSIIGLGYFVIEEGTTDYTRFAQKIEYFNDKIPSYVLVCACSSQYADDFTGGVGSTLYLDEFSFIY